MKRELFVGGVFVTLAGLLLATTIWVKDPGFFDKKGRMPATARFTDVAGLTPGSEVWIYGTPSGRVKTIQPDGKGGVDVVLDLDYDPGFRADAKIAIQQRSALGGAIVSIHPGTPGSAAWSGGTFEGTSAAGAFDALEKVAQKIGQLADDVRGPLKETVENARKITADVSAKSERVMANLDETLENAKTISKDIADGKGTLGKLLKDDKLHRDLEDAIASVKKIAEDASSGGGTIDVLLHDKQMAADLKAGASSLRSVTAKLDSGEGSLGKLLNDKKLYDDLAATAGDLRQITSDARAGKGTLGKLMYDEELAKRLDTITTDVATITTKIRKGEGTLGKLVNDEALYADLRATLKSLRSGSDDVRENAPILTFAGFLFSGF